MASGMTTDTAPLSAEKLDEIEALATALERLAALLDTPRGAHGPHYAEIVMQAAALARSRPAAEVAASRNEVLEEAGAAGYRICAETHHATLGDRVRAAIRALKSPEPQHE